MSDFQQNFIKIAIEIYGLELDPDRVDVIVATWLKKYDPDWILKAIVESLYRGRYKIVSVENILKDWQRLGNPRYKFTPEYEREILEKIPQVPTLASPPISPSPIIPVARIDVPASSSVPEDSDRITDRLALPPTPQALISSKDLDPEESAPFQSHYHSLSSRYSNNSVGSSENSEVNLELTIDEDPIAEDPELAGTEPTLDPPSEKGLFQNRHDRSKPEQIAATPTSRNLFNTLRSIVNPNHQDRSDRSASSVPPLAIGNDRSLPIANFIPIDSSNEQQHV